MPEEDLSRTIPSNRPESSALTRRAKRPFLKCTTLSWSIGARLGSTEIAAHRDLALDVRSLRDSLNSASVSDAPS